MAEFDSPTYVFDFRDKKNCSRVENAEPGEEINVLVRVADDKLGPPISAKGILSEDGVFHIKVTTAAGEQSHEWTYEFLMDAIKVNCED